MFYKKIRDGPEHSNFSIGCLINWFNIFETNVYLIVHQNVSRFFLGHREIEFKKSYLVSWNWQAFMSGDFIITTELRSNFDANKVNSNRVRPQIICLNRKKNHE